MKHTIEFNLPDDSEELLWAIHAHQMLSTLESVDRRLRTHLKHGNPDEKSAKECMALCLSEIYEVTQLLRR